MIVSGQIWCICLHMLTRDASLKQRIPCVIRISIFGAFSGEKKCALYTGKYGSLMPLWLKINATQKVMIEDP